MRIPKSYATITAGIAAAAMLTSAATHAGVVSVNFRQQSYIAGPPDGYGVEPANNWTDWTHGVGGDGNMPNPATVVNLTDSDGNASAVDVTFKGGQVREFFGGTLTNTPMKSGLISYQGGNPTNDTFLDLSGLNATFVGAYDVIVYVTGYNGAANGNIGAITDGTETFYFRVPNPYTNALIQSTDTNYTGPGTADFATYVRFDGRTNDSLYISVDVPTGAGAAGIGGFQIVGTTVADLTKRIWVGGANSNWDTSSLNWDNPVYGITNYADGDLVVFDNTAVAASPTVNLTASRSPSSVTVRGSKNYTLTGSAIAGATGLDMKGSGTVTLNNVNTYSNDTTISSGTLKLGTSGAIPDGAGRGDVIVAAGAILDLNGVSEGINGLVGAGTVDNTGAAATLTVGLDNDGGTFPGTLQGAVALTKQGTNTLTLTAASTHSGSTTVAQGNLVLDPLSAFSINSALNVSNGANLEVNFSDATGLFTSSTLSFNGGTGLTVDYGDASVTGFSTPLTTFGTLNLSGVTQIGIRGSSFGVGTFTIISYVSKTGGGSISSTPAFLPSGMAATIQDTGSSIDLVVTVPSVQTLLWSAGTGEWSTNGLFNWNLASAEYKEYPSGFGDIVAFDNSDFGTVTLVHDVHPFSVTAAGNYVLSGTGRITGPTGITRSGFTGTTFVLDNTNTYTGVTTISGGTLQVNNGSALGSPTNGTEVLSGGSLALNNAVTLSAEPLTLSGNGVSGNNGALRSLDTNSPVTVASPITLAANARLRAGDRTELIITSPITDNGSNYVVFFHANESNTLVQVNSSSNVAGIVTVYGRDTGRGTIRFGVDNVFPGSRLRAGGGTFDFNGTDQRFLGIDEGFAPQNGVITNQSASLSVLTLDVGTNDPPTNMQIPSIGGAISVVKEGDGVQSFGGGANRHHTYSGTTTINGGVLGLASDTSGLTNDFTVNAGGTLRGIATIGALLTVNPGGTFHAGYASNAIGTFTINNDLQLAGNVIVALNKDEVQSNDVINVTGSLTYGGTLTILEVGTNALVVGDTFTVFPTGGTGSFASIDSSAVPGVTFSFLDGVLTVDSVVAIQPTLNYTRLGGGVVQFDWTGDYKLQWQTNGLPVGLSTNWVDYPDTSNPVNVTNNPAVPASFFRLESL